MTLDVRDQKTAVPRRDALRETTQLRGSPRVGGGGGGRAGRSGGGAWWD